MTNLSHTHFGRFTINPYDKVTIRGKAMRLAHATGNGYVLMDADCSGVSETFEFATLSRMNAAKEIKHEPDFFDPGSAQRRLTNSTSRISDLSAKQKKRFRLRQALVFAFQEMRAEGLVTVNDTSIEANMPEICERAQSFVEDHAPDPDTIQRQIEIREGLRRKPRGGGVVSSVAPVHPRTLRNWVGAFQEFGLVGLADSIANRGNKNSYFNADERSLLMRTVKESYLSLNRPTKANTFEDVKVAFRNENMTRAEQGQTPLRVPSREAVRNAIEGLGKFEVTLARKGHEEAMKLFKPVGRGLEVDRPYERVEMDEWRIDLITILADSGLLHLFTKEELDDLGLDNNRGRWWVTAAIDCRTRCIVGMKLTLNPKAVAALDCLKMVTSDKGKWADAVGAVSGWHMAATPEMLVTDNGSAFKAGVFTDACSSLGITLERSIAGMPSMRGTVERVFRTASTDLLHRLNGRTFSSVLERGDHPAEARACLKPNDLCFALVRWIVDIYHNKPHAGLEGKTPLEQWELDSENGNYPLKAIPCVRDDRLAFGLNLTRKVDKYGVTVLGVKYHSETLSAWFNTVGKRDVDVRWFADDIGAVEVRLGDDWHQLSSVQAGFDGVHAQQWLEARRSLKTSDPIKLKWRDDVVCDAIIAIRNMSAERSLEFGLISQNWNAERISDAEKSMFVGFKISGSEPFAQEATGQHGRVLQPSKPDRVEAPKTAMPSAPKDNQAGEPLWEISKGDE